jgi:tRNA-modifying protein YgfZ
VIREAVSGEGTGQLTEEYHSLRRTVGVHALPRDVLCASGPDTVSYLQGQCSQDVSGMAAGHSAEALLLSPQGKVDAYIRLTNHDDDRFIIDTDFGFGPVVKARLERFRLRTDVTFEPLDWICLAVRGPLADGAVVGEPAVVAPVVWPGLVGVDLLGPQPAAGRFAWVGDQATRCGDAAWEAVRIEAGIPVNGRELVEGTIAAEAGLVERTVSFTKGCFTGQELVARLDSRGSKVARRLCGVVVGGEVGTGAPPVGASVLTADGTHQVGHLSSVAWSEGAASTVALATLHRRVSPPESVLVRWSGAGGTVTVSAESRPLPLVGGESG